ncbi:MAG: RNA polymerase sporulation sigma factor SigK [Clostridia bacterium]|nr:RNA polymerase sporulation sigma factor SigK [Clostridia bacterium]
MFSAAWFFVVNALFLILRIAPSGSFPKPLSAAEESEALTRMAAGDLSARDRLIEHNLRLVAHVVKKYYASHEDQDDLISIGTIGLIKGISSFDASKNIRLATYAAKCIENEILMYFRSLKKQSLEISLSEPIDSDKDGNALSLLDIISCDEDMLEEIDISDRKRLIYKYISERLDDREREIIILRYGLFDLQPLTQREIAAKCGISRSYVSRIEKKAVKKLREAFDGDF